MQNKENNPEEDQMYKAINILRMSHGSVIQHMVRATLAARFRYRYEALEQDKPNSGTDRKFHKIANISHTNEQTSLSCKRQFRCISLLLRSLTFSGPSCSLRSRECGGTRARRTNLLKIPDPVRAGSD
jgi:hypothetical protein